MLFVKLTIGCAGLDRDLKMSGIEAGTATTRMTDDQGPGVTPGLIKRLTGYETGLAAGTLLAKPQIELRESQMMPVLLLHQQKMQ